MFNVNTTLEEGCVIVYLDGAITFDALKNLLSSDYGVDGFWDTNAIYVHENCVLDVSMEEAQELARLSSEKRPASHKRKKTAFVYDSHFQQSMGNIFIGENKINFNYQLKVFDTLDEARAWVKK